MWEALPLDDSILQRPRHSGNMQNHPPSPAALLKETQPAFPSDPTRVQRMTAVLTVESVAGAPTSALTLAWAPSFPKRPVGSAGTRQPSTDSTRKRGGKKARQLLCSRFHAVAGDATSAIPEEKDDHATEAGGADSRASLPSRDEAIP